ncbi:MAG: hypothetical protein ACTFAL_09115 [Candidatus Electronema sp. V4]|uniref:hypothetical protein n=1 Tax=Candidatus Electronema sp. V4 TaxID=3454756 RepID=UPI0040556EF9
MSSLKKAASILSVTVLVSSFSFSISHADEKINLDPSILKIVDEIVAEMQQKTMAFMYAEMPFKD